MRVNFFLFFLILTTPVIAFGDTPTSSWFQERCKSIQMLVLKYYPKAEIQIDNNKIKFAYRTRTFMIHEPTMTGEWQEARSTVGPDRGGILGTIELRPGQYKGQAEVPQTFDKQYFSLNIRAPYFSNCNCHLYAHLYQVQDTSPKFVEDFRSLVEQVPSLLQDFTLESVGNTYSLYPGGPYRSYIAPEYMFDSFEKLIARIQQLPKGTRIIYEELCKGEASESSRTFYKSVIANLMERGAEGIILGCTEIELLIRPEDCLSPVFRTARIHAEAAARWSIGLVI